jgi:transcriptional regulator
LRGNGSLHPAQIFAETDPGRLEALVSARGLAVIIGASAAAPAIAHAPVLLAAKSLRFHLSAANALCQVLRGQPRALAVVTGSDAYISPDWYAAPDQVPTWNYVSVEAEGPVRIMEREETVALLDDLAAHFEAGLAPKAPWSRAKMTPARFEAMLSAIVGYEMRVERLVGISKLSQNKPADEIARVAARLAERPDDGSIQIAALMKAGEG